MGEWLKVNGESIYGTTASPMREKPSWGRITQSPGKLYLHVLSRLTEGTLSLPIRNGITKAYLLAAPDVSLELSSTPQGAVIVLPATLPDTVDTVVVAQIEGKPEMLPHDNTAHPAADGSILCDAHNVEIVYGTSLREKRTSFSGDEKRTFLDWKGERGSEDMLQWKVAGDTEGDYDVKLIYASWKHQAGNTFTLGVGDQVLNGTLELTKSGYIPQEFHVGTVHLAKGKVVLLSLKGIQVKQGGVCSRLGGVSLVPSVRK
jgi:alpha-L-fucosidase